MAGKYAPTPEQRDVIETTDRTVLLSAAAGSGKTATLTERLIAMITREKDPLDVTRMLVVTFTRAAAEELRVRISEALSAAVAERPGDKRLARQLLLLPAARIRTIDAFCNDLVKTHVEKLGISPLYRIADASELDLLAVSLLDEVIEDAYNGIFTKEGLDIATVTEIAESVKKSGTLAEQLYQLYSNLHGLRDGVASLKTHAETLLAESELPFFETRFGHALAAHYKEDAKHKSALLRKAADDLLAAHGKDNLFFNILSQKFFYFTDFYDRIAEACDVSLEELKATLDSFSMPSKTTCPTEGFDEELFFKALIAEVKPEVFATDVTVKDAGKYARTVSWSREDIAYAFRRTSEITTSVYLLLSEFEARFNAEKRRRAIFDHSDITAFAYELLCDENDEPTPLALELRAAFDTVCIDEYQDVNEIQHRLFEVISTERNRFMVGDIKQSIYAFRGAVPDIFGRLRAEMPSLTEEASSAVLFLTRNFRSEEPIIAFANRVFDFLFPIVGDSIGYQTADRLYTEKEKGAVPPPTIHLFKANKEKESKQIAKKVLALIKDGRLRDGSPIRPSDIAILTRKNDTDLVETLRRHGVPVRTVDKTDFFSRKEILLALSLAHAVSNPHRDIYLSGLLRSPLYGFTTDDLVTIRTAHATGSLYDALCAYRDAHPSEAKVVRVLADLSRFRAMAENTPSHRLIRTMFTETGIYTVTDGAGRANLRTFYELARSYEATSFRGLYRFLDHVAEMRRLGHGLPERDVGEEEAVTISTIHHSKGLEYPVCILAHTGGSLLHTKKAEDSPFRYEKALGLITPVPSKDGLALLETPLAAAEEYARNQGEMEEAVRVLYVALTRPREQLYVFIATGASNVDTFRTKAHALRLLPTPTALHTYASYGVWLLAALSGAPELCRIEEGLPFEEEEKCADGTDVAPSDAEGELLSAKCAETATYRTLYSERFSFRYPYSAETRLPAKLSVSALYPGVLDELTARSPFDTEPFREAENDEEKESEFRPTLPVFLSGKEENEAARAGSATHVFLQFCDFETVLAKRPCKETVEEELARLSSRGFLPSKDAARVRIDELAAFLSSDLAEELRSAKEVLREFRFHAFLPAERFAVKDRETLAGLSVFAQGVIDLLVRRRDGSLLLVDYKTDRLPKGATDDEAARFLFDRHGTQLSVYAHAVGHMLGAMPKIAIYSLPKGKLLTPPH